LRGLEETLLIAAKHKNVNKKNDSSKKNFNQFCRPQRSGGPEQPVVSLSNQAEGSKKINQKCSTLKVKIENS